MWLTVSVLATSLRWPEEAPAWLPLARPSLGSLCMAVCGMPDMGAPSRAVAKPGVLVAGVAVGPLASSWAALVSAAQAVVLVHMGVGATGPAVTGTLSGGPAPTGAPPLGEALGAGEGGGPAAPPGPATGAGSCMDGPVGRAGVEADRGRRVPETRRS